MHYCRIFFFARSIPGGVGATNRGTKGLSAWSYGHILVRVLGTGRTGASRSVCEAQVALIHMGGHEIGYIILIQSRF